MLGIWDGTNCAATRTHLADVIDTNIIDVHARIAELQAFAGELADARARLAHGPAMCEPGLACCAPDMNTTTTTPVTLTAGRRS